jgi:GxxExxY protein
MQHEELTHLVIGGAMEVHRALGPGLLESAYQQCLCQELTLRQVPFARELSLPVVYKGIRVDCSYRIDLLIDEQVVVEVKAVETILPIHVAQVLTYLRLGNWKVGLLINFNVPVLKEGIRRLIL